MPAPQLMPRNATANYSVPVSRLIADVRAGASLLMVEQRATCEHDDDDRNAIQNRPCVETRNVCGWRVTFWTDERLSRVENGEVLGDPKCMAQKKSYLKGFQSLNVLEGGVEDWKSGGKPLAVAANKPWSMERQVRVTAGSLVLASFGVGLLTSRKALVGAALVGAGLVYAGVSDTCMMASVLGRMPWKRPEQARA